MDSFAYLIRQSQGGKITAFRSVELQNGRSDQDSSQHLMRALQEDDVLRLNLIRELHIAWLYPVCSLVPERLYNPDAQQTYLSHLTELPANFECLNDRISQIETQLVYGLPTEKREPIVRRFSPRSEQHLSSGLLNAWSALPLAKNDRVVFSNFREQKILLACFEQGQVKFFNTFSYREAKDALYFVLLAYQQCVWSPAKVPLYISGELTEDSAVYKQLYRFVKTLAFYSDNVPAGSLGPAMQALPAYVYADLFAIGKA